MFNIFSKNNIILSYVFLLFDKIKKTIFKPQINKAQFEPQIKPTLEPEIKAQFESNLIKPTLEPNNIKPIVLPNNIKSNVIKRNIIKPNLINNNIPIKYTGNEPFQLKEYNFNISFLPSIVTQKPINYKIKENKINEDYGFFIYFE